MSLPNDGGVTPYDNPHIGSFHVPIILAHPKLPAVEINTPIISHQILPTILDLLIQTSSAGENGIQILRDMLPLYEGQSLIRPLIPEQDGKKDWQFTVMNTGGSWLGMRSAARPQFRLVVPLVVDLEWRFTDLNRDPDELHPIQHFSLLDLFEALEDEYGEDGTNYLREAAHVAEWWVLDNWRRYGYSPAIEEKSGKSDYDPNVEYKEEHGEHSDATAGVTDFAPSDNSTNGTVDDKPVIPTRPEGGPSDGPVPPPAPEVEPPPPEAGIEPFF